MKQKESGNRRRWAWGMALSLGLSLVWNLPAAPSNSLWKFKVTSPDGLRFFETAEYIGPTVAATNVETQAASDTVPGTNSARLMLHTGYSHPNGTQYSAGYYRGPFYSTTSSKPGGLKDTLVVSEVSIFSSADNLRLVVAMAGGPVYSSTNSGLAWTAFSAPGKYVFPLSSGPDGSGLFAEVSLAGPTAPAAVTATAGPQVTTAPSLNWYAVGAGEHGSQLVVTASTVSTSPALNITPAGTNMVVSWGAVFTDFILQQNSQLDSTNWVDVPFPVQVTNGLNEVLVPKVEGHNFYRLRHR